MFAISAENISKKFGQVTALDGVTFSVGQGSIFGIIGPDGAGKSTLIRVLSTLTSASAGKAEVCGYGLSSGFRSIRREIGYMPEQFSLYPDLTVWENLTFYASLFNVSTEDNFQIIEPVFRQLDPFRNRKAGKLSGGMKQKLALSCALIHRPKLLLLDEPTRGVDPVSRKEFWKILSDIKRQGIAILLSTSYMEEAMLCDTVGLFDKGRFLKIGKPQEITASYAAPLYAAKSGDLYNLLLAARGWKGTKICYTFGDSIHTVLNGGYSSSDFRNFTRQVVNAPVSIERIAPTIEDCFMNLIENGKNN